MLRGILIILLESIAHQIPLNIKDWLLSGSSQPEKDPSPTRCPMLLLCFQACSFYCSTKQPSLFEVCTSTVGLCSYLRQALSDSTTERKATVHAVGCPLPLKLFFIAGKRVAYIIYITSKLLVKL
jgi:hypothetical protein